MDLGENKTMDYFLILWESSTEYGKNYNIYVSDDINNWGTAVVNKADNTARSTEEKLTTPVKGRYVKLEVTKVSNYPNVSCWDFKIKYKGNFRRRKSFS